MLIVPDILRWLNETGNETGGQARCFKLKTTFPSPTRPPVICLTDSK